MRRRHCGMWLVVNLLAATHLGAQQREINLTELVSLALERNPGMQALAKEAEAEEYRAKAASALPEPTVGLGLRNVGLARLSVGEEMMSGVMLSASGRIPFPAKLAVRGTMAAARAGQAQQSLNEAKLALVHQVKELYARLYHAARALELLKKKRGYLETALRYAEARYAVGRGAQADLFKAQVEISRVEETAVDWEATEKTLRVRLNALLNLPADTILGTPREIHFYALPHAVEELWTQALQGNPLLKKAALRLQEEALGVKMARKEFLPDFMLTVGKEIKGPLPDMYEVMLGLEVPLFFWKKQANLLQEARLRESAASDHLLAMELEAQSMLRETYILAKAAESRIALYRERIIPQAELSLQASMAGYQVGRVDFLALLSDVDALIAHQMELARNVADLWSAAARLEELSTVELFKGQ